MFKMVESIETVLNNIWFGYNSLESNKKHFDSMIIILSRSWNALKKKINVDISKS